MGCGDDDRPGETPGVEEELADLAAGEAEQLELELLRRPTVPLPDGLLVAVGRGLRDRELADLGEEPAHERLLAAR